MQLKFTKMHGLGNDFVMLDLVSQKAKLNNLQIKKLADRNFGIGFDQLLVVEPPSQPDVDFRYRIFNADGGEVEQCGNGARCFARFVRDQKLTKKHTISVETQGGVIELTVESDGQITADMGIPVLNPSEIPFSAPQQKESYWLELERGTHKETIEIGAVSMGNPHAVTIVHDITQAPVEAMGPLIESHQRFPQRVNAGFMQIVNADEIRLRVYERGTGETLACGTGACAAVVAGRLRGLLNNTVKVNLPGGALAINWEGEGHSVKMTGPATKVFDGQLSL